MNPTNLKPGMSGIKASLQALVMLLGLLILPALVRAQSGADMSNAIPAGSYSSCGGTPFYEYGNNYYNYNNGTYYNDYMGAWSPEVWYSFTVTDYTDMELSLCGSYLNTYIHLMDEYGNEISSNDDSWECGLQSYLPYYGLNPGTYYVVVEGAGNYETGDYQLSINSLSSGSPSPGANMSNAINVGNLNSLLSYSDTRSNADGCLGDDIGQSNNDIYYQFSLSSQTTVTFSHCGSTFDTFMWLLDASGNIRNYNDDNWDPSSPCPGYQSYMQVADLPAGTYYLVSEGYGANYGDITTSISVPAATSSNCTSLASSLSQDQNYIVTYSPRDPFTDASQLANKTVCEVNQTVQYFDGLGRPLQTVQTKASPDKTKDIVIPNQYDAYGREAKKYLAYASASNDGSYKGSALSEVISYYQATPSGQYSSFSTPFSETVFEPSPLNRVVEQGAPGADWQPVAGSSSGHTVKIEYKSNTDQNGAYPVKQYSAIIPSANHIRALQDDGYYGANQLYLTISKDENWTAGKTGTVEEYKDKEGRVVLKRTWQDESIRLSTYYIYDDFGNLSYVLSPKAEGDNGSIDQTKLNDLCYQYYYDNRNRLIEKKIPGKGWEYIVYNQLDQVVLTQDALQRTNNHWNFSKYDGLGRVVITGVYGRSISRDALQAEVNNHLSADPANNKLWETFESSGSYSNASFPKLNISYYQQINYYGTYNIQGFSGSVTPTQTVTSRLTGLLTGSRTYLIDGSASYLSINYYDEYGKVIENVSENHIGGTDRVVNTYNDITGEVLSSTRTHTSSYDQVTIANTFGYDHMGRRKYVKQNINNNSPMVVASFDYTETGQLLTKNLGNTADYNNSTNTFSPGNFMLNIGYLYNEHGWLKHHVSDLFDMILNYQYNGNISHQNWENAFDNGTSNYYYIYDGLNRLISGTSDKGYSESIGSYDKNGNINQLSRTGNRAATQGYTYEGNKLTYLNGLSMLYDENGNLTSDGMRGIGISYNYLNLPKTITGSKSIAYTYDATGRKLKKVSNISGTTDYVNGIQYKNISGTYRIEFVQTEEGRAMKNIDPNTGAVYYAYQFTLKDNLGNNRVTFYRNPSTQNVEALESTNYYPFGLAIIDPSGKENKYLYNGKENQEELEELDYGARFYDPVIARWNVPDPFAHAYVSSSPYSYVLGNPIANTDVKGMWTVSRHHRMTRDALTAAGIGARQANLIAWYSSVYADNPGGHTVLNNVAHPFYMVSSSSPGRDMSRVANSQVTDWNPGIGHQNYNVWHSMRSPWEREHGTISEGGAMKRGMEWGWGQIFEASKSGKLSSLKEESQGIRQLGQGIHALQDAYAHKGTDMDNHDVMNDRFGDTSGAEKISSSAVTAFKLLSGDWDGLGDKININTTGMSADQFKTIMSKTQEYLNHRKKKDEEDK